MSNISKYFLAFLGAAVVPALAVVIPSAVGSLSMGDNSGWLRIRNFGLLSLYVSTGHVLILGIPSFIVMHIKNVIYWWSSIFAGFILGCIPIGIWTWPLKYPELKTSSSHWDGEKMVQTMIDGVPTMAGWVSYMSGVSFMGLFGAIGGLSFWLIWRKVRPARE